MVRCSQHSEAVAPIGAEETYARRIRSYKQLGSVDDVIYSRSALIASAIVACNVAGNLAGDHAHAATTSATWTGTNSTDFEDPGNWVNGTGGTGTGSDRQRHANGRASAEKFRRHHGNER